MLVAALYFVFLATTTTIVAVLTFIAVGINRHRLDRLEYHFSAFDFLFAVDERSPYV